MADLCKHWCFHLRVRRLHAIILALWETTRKKRIGHDYRLLGGVLWSSGPQVCVTAACSHLLHNLLSFIFIFFTTTETGLDLCLNATPPWRRPSLHLSLLHPLHRPCIGAAAVRPRKRPERWPAPSAKPPGSAPRIARPRRGRLGTKKPASRHCSTTAKHTRPNYSVKPPST